MSERGCESFATNQKDALRLLAAYKAGFEVSNRAGLKLSPFTSELNHILKITDHASQ